MFTKNRFTKLMSCITASALALALVLSGGAFGTFTASAAEPWQNAYLNVLQQYQTQIKEYQDWNAETQTMAEGGQVAIADICGDSTPELIFIKGGEEDEFAYGPQNQLYIYGFNGKTSAALLQNDFYSGGVHHYAIFTTSDHELYIYLKDGQTTELAHSFERYSLNNGKLASDYIVERDSGGGSHDYSYSENGNSITPNQYNDLVEGIVSKANTILMQSQMYESQASVIADYPEDGADIWVDSNEPAWGDVLPLQNIQMTYDQAVSHLKSGNSSSSSTNNSAATAKDSPSAWAESQVSAAIAAGLVPQTLQSKYTQAITRTEFCALVVRLYETATGETIRERVTFHDTNDINVQKAAAIGVVGGTGNGNFSPNVNLTREQAAVMLAALADALKSPLAEQEPAFADNSSISSWAFDAVGQVQADGIMGGVGSYQFAPKSPYTREQSIITIMKLYDAVK